jgi:RNA polymerase sigma-70 factor (ECF subfamily)
MTDQHGHSDDALIAGVASGNPSSLSALFRRRQGDVYRFALHVTGDRTIAEDVTQEVFLAVMRDAARYEPGRSSVTAWLCGIARNHARRRFERDRGTVPLEDESGGDVASENPDPLSDLTRAEGIEAVRKAVLRLPLRYREAVVLCDLQELSYTDAATALDCAIGTVRSRLHRGRTLLAARLAAVTNTRWIA